MSAANGSRTLTVLTPGGEVEVTRLRWRSGRANSRWVWVARRRGEADWCRGASAREVIGVATQLEGGAWPRWVGEAAGKAERELSSRAASE
jgi:hypothetical protein